MPTAKLTTLEAKAKALAVAIKTTRKFGKEEQEKATAELARQLTAGETDAATFSQAASEIGNVSQVAQYLAKHGFIDRNEKITVDALHTALVALGCESK